MNSICVLQAVSGLTDQLHFLETVLQAHEHMSLCKDKVKSFLPK